MGGSLFPIFDLRKIWKYFKPWGIEKIGIIKLYREFKEIKKGKIMNRPLKLI